MTGQRDDSTLRPDARPTHRREGSANQALLATQVSFRVRRLEPFIAGALAAATVWVTVLQYAGEDAAWLGTLAALAIAGWARAFPAMQAWLMIVRATMLLSVALALHVAVDVAGPAGTFFFWPAALACSYALLLRSRLAWVVAALCLAEYLLAAWLTMGRAPIRLLITNFGLLGVLVGAALAFGRSVQRSEWQLESRLTDAHTGLYNKTGLFVHGDELLAECLQQNRALSLVMLNCHELGDVRELLGRKLASQLFSNAVNDIAHAAPRRGLVARTDRLEFVLVLPGISRDHAKALVMNALGTPPRVVLKTEGRSVEVVMDATVLGMSSPRDTIESLYDMLSAKLQGRRAPHQARQEFHEAPDSQPGDSGGPLSRLELSPTLPVPLSYHGE